MTSLLACFSDMFLLFSSGCTSYFFFFLFILGKRSVKVSHVSHTWGRILLLFSCQEG